MKNVTHLPLTGVDSFSNPVDLLVHFSTVMVALLTSACNGILDTRRMPGSNTSDLSKTFVRLAREFTRVPT
jgi:hypothetical protein